MSSEHPAVIDNISPDKSPRKSLPRRCRIISPLDFDRIFATKPQWPAKTLVLRFTRAGDAEPRVGVVAGKRTFRLAVDRNRARRLLREAFRLNKSAIAPGVEMVLLARRPIIRHNRQSVERDLLRVCKQAGILKRIETTTPCSDDC